MLSGLPAQLMVVLAIHGMYGTLMRITIGDIVQIVTLSRLARIQPQTQGRALFADTIRISLLTNSLDL